MANGEGDLLIKYIYVRTQKYVSFVLYQARLFRHSKQQTLHVYCVHITITIIINLVDGFYINIQIATTPKREEKENRQKTFFNSQEK